MATMSRRHFLALAGLTGAGLTLSACAGTGGNKPQEGDKNTITWWSSHPGTSKDVEMELIKRYQEKNPDMKVNLVDAGKNYAETAQKFNAALSGGDLPDVVLLSDVWWFNFALNNQIAEIGSLAKDNGADTSTFVTSLYDDYKYKGGHYAMPFARSTPLFYYNKDAWAAAGLPDRGPQSWEEMAEWGKKLQGSLDGGKKAFGWGDAANYLSWYFEGPMWTLGGSYSKEWDFTLASDETVKAAEFLRSSVKDGWATISKDIASDFSAGLLAATVASTGDLTGVTKNSKFNVGTAFLPNPTGQGGCPTGGSGLAVPSGITKERQVNAVKFIDFVTSAENTAYWSQHVGYMPVRKTALDLPEQKKFMEDNPNYSTAARQLETTRPQDNARVFIGGGDQKIGAALETIATTDKDIKAELSRVNDELKNDYERDIKPKLK
ncbi:ABC transporter substrate-binding protein [Corynebacterium heidelbergense]|uniref:ABC transporter substrate-binding protein n=1 Tax=Corynebacterium heidelbergense TaxID=2055947 RepID=A0A364V7U0_9CORY|nr:ABC transporter substrate-binding protein [Corynebacterium heidelbergense]RAV32636.1 ABC transporter substrate-binding protein [Corynebacterium heidelbergense]